MTLTVCKRLASPTVLLFVAASLCAAERFVPIAGTVNNFRTDARVFNPSFTNSIVVEAFFLPAGNHDNTGNLKGGRTFTVQPRQVIVRDDIVKTIFGLSSDIGGILFRSEGDFEVSSRIYAVTSVGTLGQFAAGTDVSEARRNGVLLQLKSNSAYRTNIGALNPNSNAANVEWKLYDRDSAVVATKQEVMPAYAAIAPIGIAAYFGVSFADLSDAWVTFSSDRPLMPYASVIDNATSDPTYIAPQPDNGLDRLAPHKTYTVTLASWSITVSPKLDVHQGETVLMRITSPNSLHGFTVVGPDGKTVIPDRFYAPGQSAEFAFVASSTGTYRYYCTYDFCGSVEFGGYGHTLMRGEFVVGSQ